MGLSDRQISESCVEVAEKSFSPVSSDPVSPSSSPPTRSTMPEVNNISNNNNNNTKTTTPVAGSNSPSSPATTSFTMVPTSREFVPSPSPKSTSSTSSSTTTAVSEEDPDLTSATPTPSSPVLSKSPRNSTSSSSNAGQEKNNRFRVLSHEWVQRLHEVMESPVAIYGRQSGFPTLHLQLRHLVKLVCTRLEDEGIVVRDVRLNGGAASYIVGTETEESYSDLDLLFGVDLSGANTMQKIKTAVLECLAEFVPEDHNRAHFTEATLKEAYVQKMVRVNSSPADIWSLIAIGNQSHGGTTVELKFVDKMRRQFEFTVDSFQIILDSLITFYEVTTQPMTEHFYPTVVAEAVSGSFKEALYHLHNRLIATRNPEEIRGGGLLKYCKLLVEGYRPAGNVHIAGVERYMCSRFFIDFPDLTNQRSKLESYLANHFSGQDELKANYLQTLYEVVRHSTVCLMNHERRQTLHLIDLLMQQVLADIEVKQSVVHLEEFSSQNWVLDQVFYGTTYFPHAYMQPYPAMTHPGPPMSPYSGGPMTCA